MILTREGWLQLPTYGQRKNIRHYLVLIFTVVCMLTPGTNWLLLFSNKIPDVWVEVKK